MKTKREAGKIWWKRDGTPVEYKRLTSEEKFTEGTLFKLAKQAGKIEQALADLKRLAIDTAAEIRDRYNKEYGEVKLKETFTRYSFSKTIRLTVKQAHKIVFDSEIILRVKENFNAFVTTAIGNKNPIIREVIGSAFETKGGKLDVAKIMQLLSYKSRVKDKDFIKACDMLEKAIDKQIAKQYIQIALLQDDGSYKDIALNFASIEAAEPKAEAIEIKPLIFAEKKKAKERQSA
jgi:hypothetical protein